MSKGWKRRKAGRVVKRTLADGTVKEYRYAAYKKAPPRVGAESIEGVIRSYKRSPEWEHLSPTTQDGYTTYLRPLEDAFGSAHVKDVSRQDIITVRNGIAKSRGKGAATGFVRAVSALFTWAIDAEYLDRSPVHKIRRLEGGHLPAWSVVQAEVALAGLPEYLRRAVILGVYTGQRRGDLCSVKWTDYDGTKIAFKQGKTKTEVVITATPDLKAELDAWHKTRTAETILTDVKGRPWKGNKLSVVLPLALQEIGLPKGLNVHGLRKLFAAAIAEGGGTVHEIAAGTGHKTLSMVQLYTQSAEQKILGAKAVALLPRFGVKNEVTITDTTITNEATDT